MDRALLFRKGKVLVGVIVASVALAFGLCEIVRAIVGFPATKTYYLLALGVPFICSAIFAVPARFASYRLEIARRDMERLSRTDMLTDLLNRRGFFQDAAGLLKRMTQQREPVCVLMIDIDRFKAINDTGGHAAGDQVLRFVARHIGNAVAETNAPEAVTGRLGGEEFAVVLRGVRASEAVKLADRLCEFVRASRTVFEGQEIGATLSVGVSCGGAGAKIDELLRFADEAVYRAKQAGRDRWILATKTSPDVPVSASTRAA